MGKFVTSDFFNNNPGPKVTEGLSDLRNNQSAVLELPFSTPPADVTILDDNILPTSAILHVDTEGGASNDELRTITYQLSESETWHDGGVLWLKAKDPARRVTLVNSQTVNGVQTVDGKNIVLSDKYYTTLQLRSGTWYQVKHYQEIYSGASASLSGTSGLVPPASAGDQNKVLHGDGTWKSVAGKHIGEVFMYSGTDIPSGSLRLDGQSIVNVSSALPDFKAWAIDSGNAVTCTLAEYEAELSQYEDQCGKFGWDKETDTLRLPRISHFVGAALTADAVGSAIPAGLPNITGSQNGVSTMEALTGAFDGSLYHNASNIGEGSNAYFPLCYIGFDASRSSAVYGRSDTVTPSHVKFPYFIHVYESVVSASEAQASEFVGLVDGLRQDVPKLAAAAAAPSDKYIDFSGNEYTALVDGFVQAIDQHNNTDEIYRTVQIQIQSKDGSAFILTQIAGTPTKGAYAGVSLQISKGQKAVITSNMGTTFRRRFTYSNGSAPA